MECTCIVFLRRCQTWSRLICPPRISSYRDHSDPNWVEAGFGNPNQHIRKHSWWNIFRPENNLKDNNDDDSSERGISEFRVVKATESHNSNLAPHRIQCRIWWFDFHGWQGLEAWTAVLAALRIIKEQHSLSSWIQADLMIVNQLHGTVERWYSRHLRSGSPSSWNWAWAFSCM